MKRAGSRWRLLVHDMEGRLGYGEPHHFASEKTFGGGKGEGVVEVPNTEFDELVVGRWLHVEQKDKGRWWMTVGGVTLWVSASPKGDPLRVTVYGPGDYASPIPGVSYDLIWSADEGGTS